tara:strand:- start:2413 stop:3060 length:648 start_codon:yes stop_codon:yes gene_type:complete
MNIEVNEMSLDINGSKILDNVSCEITSNEFTCLVGPNGSGKSTLVKSILGEIKDFKGTISNVNIRDVCYLPQIIQDPPFLSVNETCKLGFYNNDCVEEQESTLIKLLEICGIPSISNSTFTDISVGEKQRAWLVFALAQSKDFIIMDEPLSSVDIQSREDFYSLLRDIANMNKTLLVITHDIDMAVKYSDKLIVLDKGQVSFVGPTSKFNNKINS